MIDASLDETKQSLLAGLVLQEGQGWADDPEKIFQECRKAVANAVLKQRLQEIRQIEEQARNDNDQATLEKCQRERIKINQKLKKRL